MQQDEAGRRDVQRAVLRLRAAGIALGLTLLLLSPRSDQTAAGAALLGYLAVVGLTWAARTRATGSLALLAVSADVLYAAALSTLLPPTAGSWALYAFAIATAALQYGALGTAATTAAAIVAYDAGIALRTDELRAADLWPVQLLLGVGLLIAELVWAARRGEDLRSRLRTFALVQRDLIAARDEDALLDRLTDHAVRTFGAQSAWIELGDLPRRRIVHPRGAVEPRARDSDVGPGWPLDDPPRTRLRCAFDAGRTAAAALPALGDLATDAQPLLAAARERSGLAHATATLGRTFTALRAIERDRVVSAVLADVLEVAGAVAGPAALVRPADGTIVAGDLAASDALALIRDTTPPALVRDRGAVGPGAVVSAGAGLVLAASDPGSRLTGDDLAALAALGEIAALAAARITERDGLLERNDALERETAELGERLRARDDAVASAVHELRTPLTSVHAYAQLTSRNLQSVQEQVKRLDRLIADLIPASGDQRLDLVSEELDLLVEARQAGKRVGLVAERQVEVSAASRGPYLVNADRGRIQQVLENLLGNAIKFSPADTPIEVELERGVDEVIVSVRDAGAGIPADELQRIFERHYRGTQHRDAVPGKGIGLAISREIVVAHGGRIWAASAGPGTGSAFFVALPAVPMPVAAARAAADRHPA